MATLATVESIRSAIISLSKLENALMRGAAVHGASEFAKSNLLTVAQAIDAVATEYAVDGGSAEEAVSDMAWSEEIEAATARQSAKHYDTATGYF